MAVNYKSSYKTHQLFNVVVSWISNHCYLNFSHIIIIETSFFFSAFSELQNLTKITTIVDKVDIQNLDTNN
jgi:hypothetical protein